MKSTTLFDVAFAALILASSSSTTAIAQPAPACSPGDAATIRISRIIPGGSMAGLEKAAADHARWYADHGYKNDRIFTAPMLVTDPQTKKLVPSTDVVMTFHTHDSEVPHSMEDAAWSAFVAEYRANSVIESTTHVCLPR